MKSDSSLFTFFLLPLQFGKLQSKISDVESNLGKSTVTKNIYMLKINKVMVCLIIKSYFDKRDLCHI